MSCHSLSSSYKWRYLSVAAVRSSLGPLVPSRNCYVKDALGQTVYLEPADMEVLELKGGKSCMCYVYFLGCSNATLSPGSFQHSKWRLGGDPGKQQVMCLQKYWRF